MVSRNPKRDAIKLEHIPYYKLKEIAHVFATTRKNEDGSIDIDYGKVKFDDVLTRFYQDKNLRLYLLHAIEKIEISIKTKIAYTLGEHGAYGYLEFANWCNREKYCKYYLKDRADHLNRKISDKVGKSNSAELKIKMKADRRVPVWLMINLLTLGEVIKLLELMSQTKLKIISKQYGLTHSELLSQLKCIHLVRNICAHNSVIVDFKLRTVPKIPEDIKEYLYHFEDGRPTKNVAVPVLLITTMVKKINRNYRLDDITKAVKSICKNDTLAQRFGFKDRDAINKYFGK